jgi:hypothetical protein
MAYPSRKASFPTFVVDRLLRTLRGFVGYPLLRKGFATIPEGRLNLYSPSRGLRGYETRERYCPVTEESEKVVGGRWTSPPDVARLAAEADRILTF